eukprot:CAMPEP_0204368470 /NCGR_PEP_ID=MMETSP0469-20131031/44201_1 /ASSEMBLY_ACC=CAM_ASM_000384 /TAXON_ID=2969 /ORGANISM="Oxyrrhis marina" /LENGTH=131 /DNA_ID=CAMNT_0051358033 /DNA_START=943 /DNA_END=1336 /DNA_ORIENTATION=+
MAGAHPGLHVGTVPQYHSSSSLAILWYLGLRGMPAGLSGQKGSIRVSATPPAIRCPFDRTSWVNCLSLISWGGNAKLALGSNTRPAAGAFIAASLHRFFWGFGANAPAELVPKIVAVATGAWRLGDCVTVS